MKAIDRFILLANSTKLDWLRWHWYKKYFKTRDEREQICDSDALFHDESFSQMFIIRKLNHVGRLRDHMYFRLQQKRIKFDYEIMKYFRTIWFMDL